jgi:hypothetical protein
VQRMEPETTITAGTLAVSSTQRKARMPPI